MYSVLRNIAGNRHEARWHAAAVKPAAELLELAEENHVRRFADAPTNCAKEMLEDFATIGHTLLAHPITFLRNDPLFQRCTLSWDLVNRRPGSLCLSSPNKGQKPQAVFYLSHLEDEAGDINVIVWKGTQEAFCKAILTARLLYIKGTVEIVREHVARPVVHVVAGLIEDYSRQLDSLAIKSRDFR